MSSKINKTLADLDSLINKLDEYLLNKIPLSNPYTSYE